MKCEKIVITRPPNGASLPRNKVKFFAEYRAIFMGCFRQYYYNCFYEEHIIPHNEISYILERQKCKIIANYWSVSFLAMMDTTVFSPGYVQFEINHTRAITWYNYLAIIEYVIIFITSRVALCETEKDKFYYTGRHPFKAPTPTSKLFHALFHITNLLSYNQELCLIVYFMYAICVKSQGLNE